MGRQAEPAQVGQSPPKSVKRKGHGNAYTRLVDKMPSFDLLALFEPKRPPLVPRTVYVDVPLPAEVWEPTKKGKKQLKEGVPADEVERKVGKQARKSSQYPSNQVLTAKYNVITFIPKNLLEQFRRIANIFFLILVILQFFPRFSNVSPALSALPLLAVLAITGLKDAYEDLKRHQSDRFINNIGCHVLSGPGVHNPNMTIPKSRGISMRWLGDLFPFLGGIPFIGKQRATKRAAKESDKVAEQNAASSALNDDGVTPDDFDPAERASLAGTNRPGRTFWGRRKRTLPKSSGKAKSNGVDRGEKSAKGIFGLGVGKKEGADGQADEVQRPNAPSRIETFLVDHEEEEEANAHTSTFSPASPGTQQRRNGTSSLPQQPGGSDVELGVLQTGPNKAHWRKSRWEDVKVGDFIRLRDNESLPADVIICSTSEDENVCYVETKNLDGETNLKVRQAVPELSHIRNAKHASEAKFLIKSEAPDVNMFKYSAAVEIRDGRVGKDGAPLTAPVNLNTVLLRGTVLRNTEWAIGVVVFTGIDTKIVMNSGGTPSKRGRVEKLMNPMVFLNLFLLALMCIMCAIGDHFEEVYYYNRNAYWMYGADRSDDNPQINGLVSFANAMITFQNIVPISLYISIEVVRTMQAFFIWADDDIMYAPSKRRTLARSWNLSDDLGQIEYIFSDKTGTLTQNSMQFQHCSIGGVIFKGDGEIPANTIMPEKDERGKEQAARQDDAEKKEAHYRDSNAAASGSNSSSSGEETRVAGDASNSLSSPSHDSEEKKQVKLPAEVVAPFHDAAIDQALAAGGAQAERVAMFFTNLGLCHTVLAAEDGEGHIEYKAQSPDEAALVQAAADVGFIFRGRDRDVLSLQVPGSDTVDKYELLNTLDFTSARKRMSVMLRKLDEDGKPARDSKIILFAKGADNVIFERLVPGDEDFKKTTDGHLEEFASEGLRTLTLAYKYITEEEYDDWSRRYHNATVLIDKRDEEMDKVAATIENDLRLLGATAIEDKLQDGVPEAIADLKRAGIKVWVATGDKLETAIAIGMSSNLLARDMNLIIIRGGAYGEPKSAYSQMRRALIDFFDAREAIDQFENQPDDYLERVPSNPRSSFGLRRSSSRRQSQTNTLHRSNTAVSGLSDFIDEDNGRKPGGYGLVIDGGSLQHAFAEEFTKEMLLYLAIRCKVVICCRVSPLQKALIVRLVKEGLGALCLAIGDGANDVSMIQAADVGVGVAGEEGLQAVNSSDYAIGQFRFLCKLLFVHGHWSYMRNSDMIVNFFYKEIIGIGILFFFQFYCAFSTTTVYEYTLLLFWNVFWTLLPVIAMGVMDRNLDQRVIMQVPETYRYGMQNRFFGMKRFCLYMLDGIYASAVCYFFLLYTYDTTTARRDGLSIYIYEFSTVMAVAAVLITNFYQGFNTYAWNWWVFGSVLVGPVLILCFVAIYASISPGWIWTTFYGLNYFLWESAYFWFGILFCFVLAFLPKYFMRYWNESYRATDIDILRAVAKRDHDHDFTHDPMIPGARESARKYGTGDVPPTRRDSMQMQSLAQQGRPQQGRRTTDMSNPLAHVSSRGFAFDEDPYPRRSSRPSSLLAQDGPARRKRTHSIKLGPVQLPLPHIRSPSTLKRRSKRSDTVNTVPEQDEPDTPLRSARSQRISRNAGPADATTASPLPVASVGQASDTDGYQGGPGPAMRQLSVDPPMYPAATNGQQSQDPSETEGRP